MNPTASRQRLFVLQTCLAGLALLVALCLPANVPAQPAAQSDPTMKKSDSAARPRASKNTGGNKEKKHKPRPFILPPESALAALPEFNQLILREIAQHPADGTHDYWWPRKGEGPAYDGVTTDCTLAGVRVLRGEPGRRTYCCGYTLEVFLSAYKKWLAARGASEQQSLVSPEEFARFKSLWFVQDRLGPGPSAALEAYKLGRTIPPSEAVAGDMVQLWRTPDEEGVVRGHSVIFINWVRNPQGKITAMRYWSSNEPTDGLSIRDEKFGGVAGIDARHTHYARVVPATLPAKE